MEQFTSEVRSCLDCPAELPPQRGQGRASRGKFSPRCPECQVAHSRRRGRLRTQAARDRQGKTRQTPFEFGEVRICEDCPTVLAAVTTPGRHSPRCELCKGARKRLQDREAIRRHRDGKKVDRICADCPTVIPPRVGSGPPFLRCPDCLVAIDRERQRRRYIVKITTRVEEFSDKEIYDRDGWICGLCFEPVDPNERHGHRGPNPRAVSLDHVVPLNRGGHHLRSNVRCTHQGCNARKRDRLDSEILDAFPKLALVAS